MEVMGSIAVGVGCTKMLHGAASCMCSKMQKVWVKVTIDKRAW